MKKLLLLSLIALSLNAQANTVTSNCPNDEGTVTATLDDSTIAAGQYANVTGYFTLKLKDWAYPMTAYATENIEYCFDSQCKSYGNSPAIPVVPSGLITSNKSQLPSQSPLAAGNHIVTFRMYVPEYDCSATAIAHITAN